MFIETKRDDEVFTSLESEAVYYCQDVAAIRRQQNANASTLFCFQMIHVVFQVTSANDKFRTQSYFAILDTLVSEIQRWRNVYEDFYGKFAVLYKFPSMSTVEISERAEELVRCYSEIEADFPNELLQFLNFVSSESGNEKSP